MPFYDIHTFLFTILSTRHNEIPINHTNTCNHSLGGGSLCYFVGSGQ